MIYYMIYIYKTFASCIHILLFHEKNIQKYCNNYLLNKWKCIDTKYHQYCNALWRLYLLI